MSKPILCIGSYAQKPFHIEKIGRNVYCIEELCYCIVQNAFLLDEELFSRDLFDWIETECSLEKLSDELRSMYSKRCSMSAIAGTILDYVGYNTRKEVDRTEEILRENAGMDVYQKKLARADYLMKSGRYAMAFTEYEFLLQNTPDIDRDLRGRIEHCEGVMYARLFLFNKAADMFIRAYQDAGNRESYIQYLTAVRMDLSNKDYVAFIADSHKAYEASMEVEKRMRQAEELFGSSQDNLRQRALLVYKAESKMHEYYTGIDEITESMKQEYRDLVRDKR